MLRQIEVLFDGFEASSPVFVAETLQGAGSVGGEGGEALSSLALPRDTKPNSASYSPSQGQTAHFRPAPGV